MLRRGTLASFSIFLLWLPFIPKGPPGTLGPAPDTKSQGIPSLGETGLFTHAPEDQTGRESGAGDRGTGARNFHWIHSEVAAKLAREMERPPWSLSHYADETDC